MPIFQLTPEQELHIIAELLECENKRNNGVIFGQVYTNNFGEIMCRVHHVEQKIAAQIQALLGGHGCVGHMRVKKNGDEIQ